MTKQRLNPHNEDDFDPDGWMSERPTYWLDLPDPDAPTRMAWLRHRVRQAASYFGVREEDCRELRAKVPEEEWIRLSEMALGPLPRPAKTPKQRTNAAKKQARPATPDARKTAREPKAHSQTPPSQEPGG